MAQGRSGADATGPEGTVIESRILAFVLECHADKTWAIRVKVPRGPHGPHPLVLAQQAHRDLTQLGGWQRSPARCMACGNRWVALYPPEVAIRDLRCPTCAERAATAQAVER
jgi:hypothetical protein